MNLLPRRPRMFNSFDRLLERPWAITPEYLDVIMNIARRTNPTPEAVAAEIGRPLDNTYEATIRDGVAHIPVTGPLFRRANLFTELSSASSYELIARDFNQALKNPQVRAIILDIDSPGGEVNGVAELARMVYDARGTKPIVAYASGDAASGAYWIASAADEIVLSQTSLVGSIGVRAAILDDSKALEMEGLREYVLVSSQSPRKHVDITTQGGRSQIQELLDATAEVFIGEVARNRGVDVDTVLSDYGQGGVFVGKYALDPGLADRMGSLEGVQAELSGAASGPAIAGGLSSNAEGGSNMSGADNNGTPAAADQPVTVESLRANHQDLIQAIEAEAETRGYDRGVSDERERITTILGSDEAKTRPVAARNLALMSGTPADEATKLLASFPEERQAGAEWERYMAGQNPDIGAATDGDGEDDVDAVARRIAGVDGKQTQAA